MDGQGCARVNFPGVGQRRPSALPSCLRVLGNRAFASLLAQLEIRDIFSTWSNLISLLALLQNWKSMIEQDNACIMKELDHRLPNKQNLVHGIAPNHGH
jgi:hypothetical protein